MYSSINQNFMFNEVEILFHAHPAGTSIVSDICDLSKVSYIDTLTLGSMRKSFFLSLILYHT